MHRAKMQVFEGSFVTAIGNMSVFLTFIVNLMNNLIAFVQWAVMFQRILEERSLTCTCTYLVNSHV